MNALRKLNTLHFESSLYFKDLESHFHSHEANICKNIHDKSQMEEVINDNTTNINNINKYDSKQQHKL